MAPKNKKHHRQEGQAHQKEDHPIVETPLVPQVSCKPDAGVSKQNHNKLNGHINGCNGETHNPEPAQEQLSSPAPLKSAEEALADSLDQVQLETSKAAPSPQVPADAVKPPLLGEKVTYVQYQSELQMPDIMRLIQKDLSEPYSIYTYRYFIHNWPMLCFLVSTVPIIYNFTYSEFELSLTFRPCMVKSVLELLFVS